MIIKTNGGIALNESAVHSIKFPKYFLIGSNKKDSLSFTSSVNHSVPSAIRILSRKIFVKESFGMIDIIALIIFIHAPFLSYTSNNCTTYKNTYYYLFLIRDCYRNRCIMNQWKYICHSCIFRYLFDIRL